MAIAVTQFIHWDSATLTTRLTAVQAEITRLLVAGAEFSTPGGRRRRGLDGLFEVEAALKFALDYQAGKVVFDTVGDCSQDNP